MTEPVGVEWGLSGDSDLWWDMGPPRPGDLGGGGVGGVILTLSDLSMSQMLFLVYDAVCVFRGFCGL